MTKIEERVQKLLRLAFNNPNKAEADAALQKARALILEHELNEAALHGDSAVSDIDVFLFLIGKQLPVWKSAVLQGIANIFSCRLILEKRRESYMSNHTQIAVFIASKSLHRGIEDALNFLLAAIENEAYRLYPKQTTSRNSFKTGAATSFFYSTKDIEKYDTPQVAGLVLANKQAIEDFVTARYHRIRNGKSKSHVNVGDYDAYLNGQEYGKTLRTHAPHRQIE